MTRIMVVDDEGQLRSMLRRVLERAGYEVVDAPEGKTAMAMFRSCPADLVITDIVMPEKDGIETIMEMRREFPAAKIIAISGGGKVQPDSYLQAARKLGAHKAFSKPVANEDLLTAIQDLLG